MGHLVKHEKICLAHLHSGLLLLTSKNRSPCPLLWTIPMSRSPQEGVWPTSCHKLPDTRLCVLHLTMTSICWCQAGECMGSKVSERTAQLQNVVEALTPPPGMFIALKPSKGVSCGAFAEYMQTHKQLDGMADGKL